MGLHGANNADLSTTNAQGYIEVTDVINFDSANPPVGDNFPFTADFPGTAGGTVVVNNLTEEILTWLDLQPGIYRMVVNGDNGYKVSIGVDPRDKLGLVLGAVDGGGHTFGDLLMVFQIQTAGIYPFRLLYYNANDTAASVEWLTKNQFGSKALINSSTNAAAVKAYRSGPSFPYVSRLSSSPAGFTVDFTDAPGVSLNAGSIQTTLNGSSITPSIGKTNGVTTIDYRSPTPLASGSTNTVGLTYTDSGGGGNKTRSFTFVVPIYPTIPPSYAVGAPDTTKPGFTLHVWRIDAQDANGVEITLDPNDTIAHAELELAGRVTNTATGQPYPNSAAANPVDGSFTYLEPAVINYDRNAGNFGNFTPDSQMPGIAGTTDLETANAAMEILTYVTLPAGLVQMGVNSDDGFRLSPATSVSDSRNAVTLGIFDAGRGAADSIFYFLVQQAGTYPMRLVWDNGNGDCNVEWFSVLADGTKVLINDSASTSAIKAYRAAAMAQPAPQITGAAISAGRITIQWSNGGTLESTTSLSSPINWTTTGNSSGTFSETATGTKFYRVSK